MKECRECGGVYPLDWYHNRNDGARDGKVNICKCCYADATNTGGNGAKNWTAWLELAVLWTDAVCAMVYGPADAVTVEDRFLAADVAITYLLRM